MAGPCCRQRGIAHGRRWSCGRQPFHDASKGQLPARSGVDACIRSSLHLDTFTIGDDDSPKRMQADLPDTAGSAAARCIGSARASWPCVGAEPLVLGGRNGLLRPIVQRLRRVCRARPIDQGAARHLEKPGSGVVERAEALPLAHGLHEHILQHVVGRSGVGQAVPQVTRNSPSWAHHDDATQAKDSLPKFLASAPARVVIRSIPPRATGSAG
jgi:hypothetical protein